MGHRPNSSSYGSLFAILLIIAIMIASANIGLQTLIDDRDTHRVIRVGGREAIQEDVSSTEATTFIERILNTTESDRQVIKTIQERLEQ